MSMMSYSSSDPQGPCKCGTIPKVGDTFYYTSKYSGDIIEGVVGGIKDPRYISSTTGVSYGRSEVEIRPLSMIRDEKLTDLGI